MALSWLWNERFWLPEGSTWKVLENNDPEIYLPQARDIAWTLPFGLLLVLIRYIYEKVFVIPLGHFLGVKEKRRVTVKPNPVLEAAFEKCNGVVRKTNLESVAKQSDMTVRQVEVWFKNKRAESLPSNMQKFRECSWHFTFYLLAFTCGVAILWDKSWFWETKYCWKDWPKLHVPDDVFWYYFLELSFYWCLVFTLMTDHKRKDFKEMIVHHVATILLISFSWAVNFVRVGTLVIVAHDAADYWMAAAKMAKYSRHQNWCEGFFIGFFVVWILSRLMYFPFVALWSASVECHDYIQAFPSFYFFNFLLLVLQVLHIIWTYMIGRIAFQKLNHGQIKGDVRSEEESDSD